MQPEVYSIAPYGPHWVISVGGAPVLVVECRERATEVASLAARLLAEPPRPSWEGRSRAARPGWRSGART